MAKSRLQPITEQEFGARLIRVEQTISDCHALWRLCPRKPCGRAGRCVERAMQHCFPAYEKAGGDMNVLTDEFWAGLAVSACEYRHARDEEDRKERAAR